MKQITHKSYPDDFIGAQREIHEIKIMKGKNTKEERSVIEIESSREIDRNIVSGGLWRAFGAVGFSYALPHKFGAKLLM